MSRAETARSILKYSLPALLCIVIFPVASQERKFEPVDEAGKDASWVSFRKRLMDAVERRDLKFVLGILDRNVRASIDGERGVAGFRKAWDIDAADTPLWRELREPPLFLGRLTSSATRDPRNCARRTCSRGGRTTWIRRYGAITTKDVLLKAGPHADRSTLQTLSHEIVTVTDWEVVEKGRANSSDG